jgi:putative aminopeptidase FrvX
MTSNSLAQLTALIAAHSTPGDEGEVAGILKGCWQNAGWSVSELGHYAITAHRPTERAEERPTLLICAHMDSPGFVVDRPAWSYPENDTIAQVHIVTLGNPCFDTDVTEAILKCRNGTFAGKIRNFGGEDPDRPEFCFEMDREAAEKSDLWIGDRICYAPETSVEGDLITAPFLDNRLGCWMLCRLAELAMDWNQRYRIILGATGCEEINGFGAQVLAAQVKADLVIVLDATYEAEDQGVHLGGGAVVTLSDASVLLSPEIRDHIRQIMAKAEVPIQFEAYNYSGTDARAFPLQGSLAPILALLMPTRGNHSPYETAHTADLDHWEKAIQTLEKHFGQI